MMDDNMQDIDVTCVDCKILFAWTVGEQNFMQKLVDDGKVNEVSQPKRCADCRAKKKKRFENQESNRSY